MFGSYQRSAEVYDVFYDTLVDYEANAGKLRDLIRDRTKDPKKVLEVACGTGAYATWLDEWFDITGLDISPEMLAVARVRLPDSVFVEADMTDFDLGQEFDAVLCLFSSIGYLTSSEQLVSSLAAMARHTAPGGVVVVEPWLTPDAWQEDRNLTVHTAEGDDVTIARVVSWVRSGDIITLNWGFVVGRPGGDVEAYTEEHVTRLFTQQDYLDAFTSAGLKVERDEEGPMGRGLYIGTKPS